MLHIFLCIYDEPYDRSLSAHGKWKWLDQEIEPETFNHGLSNQIRQANRQYRCIPLLSNAVTRL